MQDHIYFKRYAFENIHIKQDPDQDLGLCVIIPAFDEPEILETLKSIKSCDLPTCTTEVILVINYGESADYEIKKRSAQQIKYFKKWSLENSTNKLIFHTVLIRDIKQKLAGPGYARKVGMDEAARRFAKINNQRGIILSLDADCLVSENYLTAVFAHWIRFPDTNGVSIYYEHFTDGNLDKKVYEGIINYELHLRYYVDAQKFCGFPFAFQTVGSSFAVSVTAYMKQGGMNKRKAGEDFYFIHKITPLGEYYNLNAATVFPSPRPSNRVPFGTGRSINEYLSNPVRHFTTYNFQSFLDLKIFFNTIMDLYNSQGSVADYLRKLPPSISNFLITQNFESSIEKIKNNTQSPQTFLKAFYRWFDAFKLMKYAHYSRDNYYPNQNIREASVALLNAIGQKNISQLKEMELLNLYRSMDKEN